MGGHKAHETGDYQSKSGRTNTERLGQCELDADKK